MSWTSKTILSLVELIVYSTLIPVAIYTLYKHRRPSLLGHIYLYIFILLRITANGLTVAGRDSTDTNTTGAIINSIGLSPLLLATVGLINEGRLYISDNKRIGKQGRIIDLVLHLAVITGTALLATGNSKAATAASPTEVNKSHTLAYAGAILLLLAWLFTCIYGIWTFRSSRGPNRLARLLLTEILVSLPFIGVRVCYSMVYTVDHSANLNPATSSFLVDFFLLFLVQLIAFLILLLGLVVTRKISASKEAQLPVGNGETTMIDSV